MDKDIKLLPKPDLSDRDLEVAADLAENGADIANLNAGPYDFDSPLGAAIKLKKIHDQVRAGDDYIIFGKTSAAQNYQKCFLCKHLSFDEDNSTQPIQCTEKGQTVDLMSSCEDWAEKEWGKYPSFSAGIDQDGLTKWLAAPTHAPSSNPLNTLAKSHKRTGKTSETSLMMNVLKSENFMKWLARRGFVETIAPGVVIDCNIIGKGNL